MTDDNKIPERFKEIIDAIGKMTMMELADLIKAMEKAFGVSAQLAVSAAAPQVVADSGTKDEEKSSFTIELKSAGSQKIQVIKVLRDLTGLGLKEAKDLVDAAPKIVREGVDRKQAEEIKQKLESAGAVVELK